jgi:hypothetical protein
LIFFRYPTVANWSASRRREFDEQINASITYTRSGRQFNVIAVPDDPADGEPARGGQLIAYALAETRSSDITLGACAFASVWKYLPHPSGPPLPASSAAMTRT